MFFRFVFYSELILIDKAAYAIIKSNQIKPYLRGDKMKIISDYAGGNIIFKGFKKENGVTEIFLEQDMRDTDRWWFYWNFRIDEPPVGKVRFTFCNGKVVCPYGAAVSEDGQNWRYDPSGYEDACHFTYLFETAQSRYFAFTLPYQVFHFEKFFSEISSRGEIKRTVLTKSEKGRDIPLLTFGSGGKDVVFTARHHCCESTASYALEGVIEGIFAEHGNLPEKYRFHVIPFIDIDGAENGDQGKCRKPHDHNRDYTENPIYSSVKALKEYAEKLNCVCFIDFHSPWRWGGADSRPHIHLTSYAESNDELEDEFVSALKTITESSDSDRIKYDGYITHPVNSANQPDTSISDNYFRYVLGSRFALTIETPYSGDFEEAYTPEMLRKWGKAIAKAFGEVFG